MTHQKQHESSERGGRGRGRGGRGRGGRDQPERDADQEEVKVEEVQDKESLKFQNTSEKKLELLFKFLYTYLLKKYKAGDFKD